MPDPSDLELCAAYAVIHAENALDAMFDQHAVCGTDRVRTIAAVGVSLLEEACRLSTETCETAEEKFLEIHRIMSEAQIKIAETILNIRLQ